MGSIFKYAGIVIPLIRLPCVTNCDEIVTIMIILLYLEGELKSDRGVPATLERSRHCAVSCLQEPCSKEKGHFLVFESKSWPAANKKLGASVLQLQGTKFCPQGE